MRLRTAGLALAASAALAAAALAQTTDPLDFAHLKNFKAERSSSTSPDPNSITVAANEYGWPRLMKHASHRFLAASLIVAAAFPLLVSSMARAQDGPCSNASLTGTFGFYRTGTIKHGVGGLAAVGFLSFDGNGNATVNQSISRNGDYSYDNDGTFNYEVNADCTGRFLSDGQEFSRFVVVDSGRGIYMFSESDGNAVHGVGTKINTN